MSLTVLRRCSYTYTQTVKTNVAGRNVQYVVTKKEEEWWPRLTKEKVKSPHIQIDWAKWKDEDDDEASNPFDTNGMNGMVRDALVFPPGVPAHREEAAVNPLFRA